MCSVRLRKSPEGLSDRRWKLLLWTAVASLIFGLIGFGEIAGGLAPRRAATASPAQGQRRHRPRRDRRPLAARGRPLALAARRHHARTDDKLTEAGAKRIFFDVIFDGPQHRRGRRAAGRGDRADPAACRFRFAHRFGHRNDEHRRSIPAAGDRGKHVELGVDQRPVQLPERGLAAALFARGRGQATFRPSRRSSPSAKPRPDQHFIPDYSIDPSVDPGHCRVRHPSRQVRPADGRAARTS